MLPEVKAYFDAIGDKDYRRQINRIDRTHPIPTWDHTLAPEQVTAYFEAEANRNTALRELETARKKKQSEAYQSLMTSQDPLVRWLISDPEVRHYPEHAHIALKALPMTREEMEEFGDNRSWCSEFRRLFQRAAAAGVLPEPTPDLADIDALVTELQNWYGVPTHKVRRLLNSHLPAILASAEARKANATPAVEEAAKASA